MASFSDVPFDPEPAPRPPVKPSSAPTITGQARGFVRFLYCSNPFYVISAGLILWGLFQSFEAAEGVVESLTLMSSLWGYALLLAAAAVFLIRWGGVWDDCRTILLLIVLMFLAGSVTFDRVLVNDFELGRAHAVAGLGLSMLISELVLFGTRLRLPLLFRLPYHAMLALFFLYPIELASFTVQTKHPATAWLLLAFPNLAAVCFLLLLPAVRRGAGYVRENGSPWQWPLYPWTLFLVLGFGVAARSYMLCVTFHPILGETTIFAPYFLALFLLVLCVLGLEVSRVEQKPWLAELALVASVAVLAVSAIGLQADGLQRRFVEQFVERLGCTPFYAVLLITLGFYLYAMLRKFGGSVFLTTCCLLLLAGWGPNTRSLDQLTLAAGWPLILLGSIPLVRGLRSKSSPLSFAASCSLLGGLCIEFQQTPLMVYRGAIPLHLLLVAILACALGFDDPFARFLRHLGACYLLLLGAAGAIVPASLLQEPPAMWLVWHPLAMFLLACGLGVWWRELNYVRAAWLVLASWIGVQGAPSYLAARGKIVGLDWLATGAGFFLLAFYISLRKANLIPRWLLALVWGRPTTDSP